MFFLDLEKGEWRKKNIFIQRSVTSADVFLTPTHPGREQTHTHVTVYNRERKEKKKHWYV